jgi:hypothetical protein
MIGATATYETVEGIASEQTVEGKNCWTKTVVGSATVEVNETVVGAATVEENETVVGTACEKTVEGNCLRYKETVEGKVWRLVVLCLVGLESGPSLRPLPVAWCSALRFLVLWLAPFS